MHYHEEAQRFVVYNSDHEEIGEITFRITDDSILIIDHTFVDPNYRGQKIANELVKLVVDKARNESYSLLPLCPFAVKEFDRHPAYQEIQKR